MHNHSSTSGSNSNNNYEIIKYENKMLNNTMYNNKRQLQTNIFLSQTFFFSGSSLFSGVGRYHVVYLRLPDVFEFIKDQYIKSIGK